MLQTTLEKLATPEGAALVPPQALAKILPEAFNRLSLDMVTTLREQVEGTPVAAVLDALEGFAMGVTTREDIMTSTGVSTWVFETGKGDPDKARLGYAVVNFLIHDDRPAKTLRGLLFAASSSKEAPHVPTWEGVLDELLRKHAPALYA